MNPIVGIGELLWDVFPDGRRVAGGAPFNFAFHCRQLGHDAVIVSRVGDDEPGRELRNEVRRLGLSDEFIQTDYEHPTGTVRVTADERGQPAYTITEDVAWDYIEPEPRLYLLAEFAAAVSFGSIAQRAERSSRTIYDFLAWMNHGLRVFDVNLRPTAWRTYTIRSNVNRANWLKLSEDELAPSLQAQGRLPAGRPPHARDLWDGTWLSGGATILLTKGERGCEIHYLYPDDSPLIEPGIPTRVVDTVGAGDAFTAAMVCLHLEGRPLRECARFANHYAARVCEHQGATPTIDRAEVERTAFG